jgi:hypothetical protein
MPKKSPRPLASVPHESQSSTRRPSRPTKRPQRFLETTPNDTPRALSPVASTSAGTGTGMGEMHIMMNSLQSLQAQIARLETRVSSAVDGPRHAPHVPQPAVEPTSGSEDDSGDAPSDTSGARHSRPRKRRLEALRRSRSASSDVREDRPARKRGKKRGRPSPPSSSAASSPATSGEDTPSNVSSDNDTDFEEYDVPKSSFGTVSGQTVTAKLKAKILANKFHEMAELLPNFKTQKTKEYSIQQSRDHTPKFLQARPKCDINFGQWCEAFNMFTSISIEKAKTRDSVVKLAKSLLTYSLTITSLYRRNFDWAAYDRHFRWDRVSTKDSWATIRHDLLMLYRNDSPFRSSKTPSQSNTKARSTQPASATGTAGKQTVPKGYCIAYHSKGTWCETKDCTYLHVCSRCRKPHPMFRSCNNEGRFNNAAARGPRKGQKSEANSTPNQ